MKLTQVSSFKTRNLQNLHPSHHPENHLVSPPARHTSTDNTAGFWKTKINNLTALKQLKQQRLLCLLSLICSRNIISVPSVTTDSLSLFLRRVYNGSVSRNWTAQSELGFTLSAHLSGSSALCSALLCSALLSFFYGFQISLLFSFSSLYLFIV